MIGRPAPDDEGMTTCHSCGDTLRTVYAVHDEQMHPWHLSCLDRQRSVDAAETLSIARCIVWMRTRA
jgi:hypothetical protein